MKKLLLLVLILMVGNLPMMAAEPVKQDQTVEDVKAVVAVQKQPTQDKANQKQEIRNIWFSIIVQVQGKVPGLEKEEK